MPDTRREFLQAAALAAGFSAGAPAALAEGQQVRPPGAPTASPQASGSRKQASEVQVPKMKFGGVEISRLIAGCNPFYGFGHYNSILSTVMKEYYTPERICEVLHQCNRFGINAHNWVDVPRARQDLERFEAEGGKMHLIVQGVGDPAAVCKAVKPLAIYHHGEHTDKAYQNHEMATVKEWCKKARDLGVMVGVGSHKPEVIAQVEEEGWDVDFYAGCVYNRTRTTDEWKQVLNNELLEMQGDVYLRSDPPRMYRVMRQTRKPCFAFKIMAAGRIDDRGADQAFRTAFESIKPTDGVFIGLFPRVKDEVREDAERVHRILAGA
jgi:hypothetical protein